MRKESEKTKEEKLVTHYFECFSSESGRIVLKDMMNRYHNLPSFVQGDQHQTAFNEGQRFVLLDIVSKLRSAKHPEIFEHMQDDYLEE